MLFIRGEYLIIGFEHRIYLHGNGATGLEVNIFTKQRYMVAGSMVDPVKVNSSWTGDLLKHPCIPRISKGTINPRLYFFIDDITQNLQLSVKANELKQKRSG